MRKAKELAGTDDEVVDRNLRRIVGNPRADKAKKPLAKQEPNRKNAPPRFDAIKGNLAWNGQTAHIADMGDYQHHICQQMFTQSNVAWGAWVEEQRLEDTFSYGTFKSGRWVKDAVYKINAKAKNELGIAKLLDSRNSRVRVVTENFE